MDDDSTVELPVFHKFINYLLYERECVEIAELKDPENLRSMINHVFESPLSEEEILEINDECQIRLDERKKAVDEIIDKAKVLYRKLGGDLKDFDHYVPTH
jgi:hypothetical protein